ncbi:MAG: hypothetical protein IANPNBLG_02162 [Bryobacteraceae bacterium]|nr:hypothetical protein [Bryobacteraceae bacterium]
MEPYQRFHVTGRFVFDGDKSVLTHDVAVQIEQSGSGRTFLLHEDTAPFMMARLMMQSGSRCSFVGVTNSGLPVETSTLMPHAGGSAEQVCYFLQRVTLGDLSSPYDHLWLALTNFVFEGDEPATITFRVECDGRLVALELSPIDDYWTAHAHLTRSANATVTANLKLGGDAVGKNSLDLLLNDVCATLSLIQGRKIQWISRTAVVSGRTTWADFGSTKTKDYTHGLFCFNPDTGRGISVPLSAFETCFPVVQGFRSSYDEHYRIINSWLDARVQADFLDARTLKYAVVMEALCRFVESKHPSIDSTYFGRTPWRAAGKELLPKIKEYLERLNLGDADARESVCSRASWGNLNRRSFRSILAACLKELGVTLYAESRRIRRFTDVRNKIVHSFTYLSEEDQAEFNWPSVSESQQHFLVACFVDEVLLRLFGLGHLVTNALIDEFVAHSEVWSAAAPHTEAISASGSE